MNGITEYKSPSWRRVALFSAIAACCNSAQFAYADTATSVSSGSPFVSRPFNLIDEFSTKSRYGSGKPSVMLLVDDSSSMETEVGLGELTEDNVCKDAYTYLYATGDKALEKYKKLVKLNDFTIRFYGEEIPPPDDCRMVRQLSYKDDGNEIEKYNVYLPNTRDYIKALSNFPSRNKRGYADLSSYIKQDYSKTIPLKDNTGTPITRDAHFYYKNKGLKVSSAVMKSHLWFKNIPSEGRRSDIVKSSLKKVLTKYGDNIDWNLMSLWGSEDWNKRECATELKSPSVYPYGGADQIINKLPNLFGHSYRKYPGYSSLIENIYKQGSYVMSNEEDFFAKKDFQRCDGYKIDVSDVLDWNVNSGKKATFTLLDDNRQTPLVWRYLQAAQKAREYVIEQSKELNNKAKECRNDFIIVFADGIPTNQFSTLKNGISSEHLKRLGYDEEKIFGTFNNLKIDHTALGQSEGIAFFSSKLFNTNKLGGSKIQTFTIGFGINGEGRKFLVNAAQALKPGEKKLPVATGSGDNLDKYGFWNARDQEKLDEAFEAIFQNILAQSKIQPKDTGSIASPGNVSSSKTGIAATLTLYTGNWSSLLKFFELDRAGKPKIGTSKNAEYVNERSVLVSSDHGKYWLMQNSNLNNKLKLSSTGTEKDEWLANAMNDFGFDNKEEFTKAFIPWLVREKGISDDRINALIKNVKNRKVSIYRNRLADLPPDVGDDKLLYRQMGDVLAAPVVGIDAGKKGSNRRYVVTGANDGMVYIFQNTDKSDTPYTLKLNYIPAGIPREGSDDTLAKNLYKLAKNNYGSSDNPHIYGVNGGITYVKTSQTAKKIDNSVVKRPQEILALGAMGQGGRGIYALKIAGCDRDGDTAGCDPVGLDAKLAKWQTSVPLWESKAVPDDPSVNKSVNEKERVRLGYTVGKPLMYQLATKWDTDDKAITTDGVRVAGFVGNGFPPLNDSLPYDTHPTLYVYDVLGEEIGTDQEAGKSSMVGKAGTLLGKISVKKSDIRDDITLLNGSDGVGALSSPAVVDVNRDGIADIAYAGDYAGNLYRFDLRGEPSEWEAVKIYQGNTVLLSNGKKLATQPITAAPSVYRDSSKKLIVLFGTGSDLFEGDVIPRSCDSLSDNAAKKLCKEKQYWDYRQGFFGIKDDISVTGSSISPISRDQLVLQSFSLKKEDGNEYRDFETEKLVPVAGKGWWFELNPGETGSVVGRSNTVRTKSAEKAVTKPVVLLDTVFFSTRIYHYDEINKENIGTAQCPVDKSGKKSGGESWLMGVNVFTGATPSGVTFKDKKNAGIKLDHLASGVVLNQSASRKMENALKNNSEVGDGVLGDLNDPPTEPKKCLTSDDYFLMLSQASKDNPLYSREVTGPICPNPGLLVRLNIHEIIE